MKNLILFATLILCVFIKANAQIEEGVSSFGKVSWNINNITVGYEKAISKKSTIQMNGGLWYSFQVESSRYNDALSPFISVEYRNYYNILKRSKQQKSTVNNAANFFVAEVLGKLPAVYYKLDDFDKKGAVSLRVGWGLQRPISKKISFQLQGGLAVVTDFNDGAFRPHLKTGFSYAF